MATLTFFIRNRYASLLSILTQKQPPFLQAQLKPYKNFYIFSIIKTHLSNQSQVRSFSKASEAAEKDFWKRAPVKYDLLAEFDFFQKTDVSSQCVSYIESVSKVISKFEHQKFRSIPFLNPGRPGNEHSISCWGEMAIKSKNSSCFLLCGKFDLLPVAIRTDRFIFTLNQDLWKKVKYGYYCKIEEAGGLKPMKHDFSFFEMNHSVERINLAVDTLVKGSIIQKGFGLDSALSTVVMLCCYSSKVLLVRQFFESVLKHPEREHNVPDDTLTLMMQWGEYSKEIHAGADEFVVGWRVMGFDWMKNIITIMNSSKEKRFLVFEEEKIHPYAGKPKKKFQRDRSNMFGGGLFDGFIDLLWGLLARTREVPDLK